MSTTSTIAAYIQHNRNLGKRFVAEEAVLLAFSRSVGRVPLHGIHPAMITQFVNRDGASVETIARKRRVLVGFFRYAVTRCELEASPMPSFERKRSAASFTPYIFSEAELKQLLAAAPAASGPRSEIDGTPYAPSCCSCTAPDCVVARRAVSRSQMSTCPDRCSTFEARSSSRFASSQSAPN